MNLSAPALALLGQSLVECILRLSVAGKTATLIAWTISYEFPTAVGEFMIFNDGRVEVILYN